MKTPLLLKLAVLAAVLSGMPYGFPQAQSANEAESAKHFLENLYSRYGANGNLPNLSGDNADQFFDPSLVKLAKDVHAAAGSRYSGALDYDHLCNCKDTNITFQNLRIVVHTVAPHRAVATATFSMKDGSKNTILINVTLEADQWRISDIKDYTGPPPYISLRGLLQWELKAWPRVQPSP